MTVDELREALERFPGCTVVKLRDSDDRLYDVVSIRRGGMRSMALWDIVYDGKPEPPGDPVLVIE